VFFALSVLLELSSPARALTADGITYVLQATSPLNATTVSFDLQVTGINGPADTEGGRFGVQSFAFNNIPGGTGNFSSATGPAGFTASGPPNGLNSGGCDGSGSFVCFGGPTPGGPALPANSTLDLLFSVTLFSGNFLTWAPDLKINWVGTQNNYDLVSQAITVTAVPAPTVGAGLPGLMAACVGLLVLGRRRRQKIA